MEEAEAVEEVSINCVIRNSHKKKEKKKIYRQLLFRENHLKPTVELCLLKTHVTERDKGGLIARIIFNFLALQTKTVTLNKHFCFTPL